MTGNDKPEMDEVDALLAAARDARPGPSPAFMARLEDDALAVQADLGCRARKAPGARRTVWRGGWQPFAGLAACLVVGVGLGFGGILSVPLAGIGDGSLAAGTVLVDDPFLPSLQDAFLVEEG